MSLAVLTNDWIGITTLMVIAVTIFLFIVTREVMPVD